MTINRVLLCLLSVFLVLTACKKDIQPNPPGTLLKKIVIAAGDSITYVNFNYDADKRLTGHTITNNRNIGVRWETVFGYDTQNNLVFLRTVQHNDQTKDSVTTEIDSLFYQNTRLVLKVGYSYGNVSVGTGHKYAYNSFGNVIADSSFFWSNQSFYGFTRFTYDANENIIQWEYIPKNPSSGFSRTVTATYNNTLNAFAKLGDLIYFTSIFFQGEAPLLLSKYNVTKTLEGAVSKSYAYDYNSTAIFAQSQ